MWQWILNRFGKYFAVLALMIGSFAAGYWSYQPRETEKIVEVEKQLTVNKKKNNTTTVVTQKPDGTTETIVIDKDKETTVVENTEISVKEKTVSQKNYAISLWAESPLTATELRPAYEGDISRRLFGDVWLGVSYNSKKEIGLGLRYEF